MSDFDNHFDMAKIAFQAAGMSKHWEVMGQKNRSLVVRAIEVSAEAVGAPYDKALLEVVRINKEADIPVDRFWAQILIPEEGLQIMKDAGVSCSDPDDPESLARAPVWPN
jgi:hypothetical protein